jgi:hypothetical protein
VVSAGVIGLALSWPALARAESVRVAVIHSAQQDEQARRLCAEVRAAGLDAVDVAVSSSEPRSTAKLTRGARAVSALRIRAGGDLELVVIDGETGRVLEQAVLSEQGSRAELDLKAVEDLRAKMVELDIAPPRATADPRSDADRLDAPSASAPKTSRSDLPEDPGSAIQGRAPHSGAASRLWLQAAAGGALGRGGLSGSALSSFGLRFEAAERWSVSGRLIWPLSAQHVANQRGAATVDVSLLGATLGVVPLRAQSVALELSLGGALVHANMHGFPATGADAGRAQSVWSGALLAEVSLAFRAASWLRVRAAGVGGAAAPRPTVRFDGEPAASWGRPFAAATVGVELAPFRATEGAQ